MELKAGARALRSVMEEHLLDIMYYIPEMEGVERVIITRDTILKGRSPYINIVVNGNRLDSINLLKEFSNI